MQSYRGWFLIIKELNVNNQIKVDKVRLISAEGEQLGIKTLEEALRIARENDMDLVEVSPQSEPPVCRVMDYGKYKYEQTQKEKKAKKKRTVIIIKEIKMRPKIGDHDFEVKKKHIEKFLEHRAKVKVTMMFRGRELVHEEIGRNLLARLVDELADSVVVESPPTLEGRNIVMVLAPQLKKEKKVAQDKDTQ